ncbi:MAG: nucleotidyltransferase family protein [Anaerovoracaceae bacterium]|nr:nucleotidyltransferase family protein [Anaerovoracaceae bacterium]
MKVTGIIAEYDPFHNGHSYHIKKAREMTGADAIVVVMSGHFTQRGMPVFFRRDARVRMAVDGGADLVIELPYIYACNSSHEFARGAAGILNGIGCVDALVFGAETDDMDTLGKAARAAAGTDDRSSAYIKEEMKNGVSYPEALTRSVEKIYGAQTAAVLREPNNLLGIEYMKALRELGSGIKPFIVGRRSAAHGESLEMLHERKQERRIASGTAVRKAVYAGGARAAEMLVPDTSFSIISGYERSSGFSFTEYRDKIKKNMFELLKYKIITSDESELAEVYGVAEGLENRLKSCISGAEDIDGLIDSVKSKRYTRARISRTLMHLLINLRTTDFETLRETYCARVLGFSPTGGKLLRLMSESSAIPVFSNLSRLDKRSPEAARVLKYDMRASDVYALLYGSGDAPGRERRFVPYAAGRK